MRNLILVIIILAWVFPSTASGGETPFWRFVDLGGWKGRLETALAAYENDEGARVTLAAAVHSGDGAYYRALQERLDGLGLVLCEGWKEGVKSDPEEPLPPRTILDRLLGWLGRIEGWVYEHALELEDQWTSIDYERGNFINADMTRETFLRRVRERRELEKTALAALRLLPEAVAEEWGKLRAATRDDIAAAIEAFRKDWRQALRFIVGRETVALNDRYFDRWIGSEETVTIGERDELVVGALRERLEAGARDIGIFYGAAHMPDLERRILKMGFRQTGTEWITAWDCRRRKARGDREGGESK